MQCTAPARRWVTRSRSEPPQLVWRLEQRPVSRSLCKRPKPVRDAAAHLSTESMTLIPCDCNTVKGRGASGLIKMCTLLHVLLHLTCNAASVSCFWL